MPRDVPGRLGSWSGDMTQNVDKTNHKSQGWHRKHDTTSLLLVILVGLVGWLVGWLVDERYEKPRSKCPYHQSPITNHQKMITLEI
jgi:hypothetical protein